MNILPTLWVCVCMCAYAVCLHMCGHNAVMEESNVMLGVNAGCWKSNPRSQQYSHDIQRSTPPENKLLALWLLKTISLQIYTITVRTLIGFLARFTPVVPNVLVRDPKERFAWEPNYGKHQIYKQPKCHFLPLRSEMLLELCTCLLACKIREL